MWSPSTIGGATVDHAALLVEVQFRGIDKPALMQLDTGCDANLVYDIPLGQLGLDSARTGQNRVSLAGSVAGTRFEGEPFFIRKTGGVSWLRLLLLSLQQRISAWKGKPVLLGTIGAPFLERRVLLLDFVADRAALLGEGDALPAAAARVAFALLDYRDRKMFLAMTINGIVHRDLAFDTGSSASPLLTTKDRWLSWTARKPDHPQNTIVKAWAWDRYISLIGAPIRSALCVGAACLDSPLAFFESSGAPNLDFDRYPFKIAGVIGNALFDRRFTVIVDLPRRRFGLYRGSLARAESR